MYRTWVLDENVECCVCESELLDEYFDVNGDYYCEDCFERQFKD